MRRKTLQNYCFGTNEIMDLGNDHKRLLTEKKNNRTLVSPDGRIHSTYEELVPKMELKSDKSQALITNL